MNNLKYLSLFAVFAVVSCSSNISSINENLLQTQNIVFDAGYKNGSDISVQVNLDNKSFQVKDSMSGSTAKTKADVKSLEMTLIRSTSANGFPDNGDLTTAAISQTSYTFDRTGANQGLNKYTFNFKNVPPSGTNENGNNYYYYATVTAYSEPLVSGTNPGVQYRIVKKYNGSQTASWNIGISDTNYARLGISSNSVRVSNDYKVNTSNPLVVNLNLENATAATIEGLISPKSGSDDLPATTIN